MACAVEGQDVGPAGCRAGWHTRAAALLVWPDTAWRASLRKRRRQGTLPMKKADPRMTSIEVSRVAVVLRGQIGDYGAAAGRGSAARTGDPAACVDPQPTPPPLPPGLSAGACLGSCGSPLAAATERAAPCSALLRLASRWRLARAAASSWTMTSSRPISGSSSWGCPLRVGQQLRQSEQTRRTAPPPLGCLARRRTCRHRLPTSPSTRVCRASSRSMVGEHDDPQRTAARCPCSCPDAPARSSSLRTKCETRSETHRFGHPPSPEWKGSHHAGPVDCQLGHWQGPPPLILPDGVGSSW